MKQGEGYQRFVKRTHCSDQASASNNIRDNSAQGHHQMVNIKIRLIVISIRWKSSIQLVKTRLGVDCGLDHQLLVAEFRGKLKIVRKITRSLKYNLNQISYDYTVEVTNRFKGLDLVDRVPEELWTEVHNIVLEMMTKAIPKKMRCKKAKWLSEEALQNAEKRSESKEKSER